ncbi:unnamed protein product [Prunus armeniaca]
MEGRGRCETRHSVPFTLQEEGGFTVTATQQHSEFGLGEVRAIVVSNSKQESRKRREKKA